MPLAAYPLRADIRKPKSTENATGNPLEDYEDHLAGVPVWLQTLRGREFWEARTLYGETVERIKLRYIPGITEDMQLVIGDDVYEIIPPINNAYGRNKELVLTVKKVE